MIGEIEKYLANNSTEQEIIADLEKACNILPKDIAAECDTIVSTYGPELIQDLVKYADLDVRDAPLMIFLRPIALTFASLF